MTVAWVDPSSSVVPAHAGHALAHAQTPFADLVFGVFLGGEIDYFAAQHHVNGATWPLPQPQKTNVGVYGGFIVIHRHPSL